MPMNIKTFRNVMFKPKKAKKAKGSIPGRRKFSIKSAIEERNRSKKLKINSSKVRFK